MIAKIKTSELGGDITAPPSKSYAHRLLIAAALSCEQILIKNIVRNRDIDATVGALASLGAKIVFNEQNKTATVNPIPDEINDNVKLFCGESGTTLRLILPIVTAFGLTATFNGEGELPNRPLSPLIGCLSERGVKFTSDRLPLKCQGSPSTGVFNIDGSVSSQFISGLLLALPLLDGDSEIKLTEPPASKPYIDITLDVLKMSGIDIKETEKGYFVRGNQFYNLPKTVEVEGDFSNAAFFLCAGALNGKGINVHGLNIESSQGDRQIIDVLSRMNADISYANNVISVRKSELVSPFINCNDIPDVAPIIAVTCAFSEGVSRLYGVERLRFKECDRLEAIIQMLKKAGIKLEYDENGVLLICGKQGRAFGAAFDCKKDHRMVMSASILGACAKGTTIISEAEAVTKSYPDFFKDLESVGGRIEFE